VCQTVSSSNVVESDRVQKVVVKSLRSDSPTMERTLPGPKRARVPMRRIGKLTIRQPQRAGLPVPFACNETHELGEDLVGSYRYQVHLLHWLESNVYGVFLPDNDLYIKVKRMVYLSDRSNFKTGRNNCAAHPRERMLEVAQRGRAVSRMESQSASADADRIRGTGRRCRKWLVFRRTCKFSPGNK
jgi:hypothetical protein